MKLACSTWMMPGRDFSEKMEKAAEYGFEGVEIRLFEEEATQEKIKEIRGALKSAGVTACSLIMPGETYRKPLLDEAAKREKTELAKKAIAAAAEFHCPTIICPEYGPQIPLPLFDHPRRPSAEQHRLLVDYLAAASEFAGQNGTQVMIEPINRYETRFFYTLADGRAVIEEVGSDHLFLLADFFHMNIEERDIPEAVRTGGERILHVHLGDSNRYLPGQGHTDFRGGFAVLREIGYDRFMALECSIQGEPDAVLPQCAAYLRECQDGRG